MTSRIAAVPSCRPKLVNFVNDVWQVAGPSVSCGGADFAGLMQIIGNLKASLLSIVTVAGVRTQTNAMSMCRSFPQPASPLPAIAECFDPIPTLREI